MASPPGVEDQARLLDDAMIMVRQQTQLMRKCLETPGKLMDALKCRYTVQRTGSAAKFCADHERACIAPRLYPNCERVALVPSNTTSSTWQFLMHCDISHYTCANPIQ